MDSIEVHNHLVNANIFQEMELEKNTRYEWNKHRPPVTLHSLCLSQFSESVRQKADEVLVHVELKLYSLFFHFSMNDISMKTKMMFWTYWKLILLLIK